MTRYFISDHHFGHASTWEKFKRADGSPLRAFTSTEEMDETMIANWNAVVKPEDSVYHLGDFVINRKFLHVGHRLNGRKRLIRGNHDLFKTKEYLEVGFEEIYGVWVEPKDKIICSHIPIHPDSLKPGWLNIHGHLHYGRVLLHGGPREGMKFTPYPLENFRPYFDLRYVNVAVEMTNYTPITLEQVRAIV